MNSKLAVFDFDNTIIDVNSDTFVDRVILKQKNESSKKYYEYPVEIEQLTKSHNWTHRMNAVFSYMNLKYSIQQEQIVNCMHEIFIEDSMKQLIKKLHAHGFELVIISDANSIFIHEILRKNNLDTLFSKIYTNKAEFCATTGCLKVQPFNECFNSNKELFNCSTKVCSTNICKGEVLKRHLDQANGLTNVTTVVYIGDGKNDYCPGLCLRESDFYFVRENYSLSKLLDRRKSLGENIKAKIIKWSTAKDILPMIG
ncbi:pyridoxal phosphate phosphatase PHOSPHO2-like [Brachionus plicatilis]|uniref:Pyridoxal phosphate phosphatase PHOSPHO2-like n=1 Tax=Brachionus plicatilis TaxID=10195 RepID=A0A3M7RKF2_BRAPC|nr:pyridoxal phosphate phosphatase PHOSPHO2-like [Brachionus plicatilis]